MVDKQSVSKNRVSMWSEKIRAECERDTEPGATILKDGKEESACKAVRNEYVEKRKNSE